MNRLVLASASPRRRDLLGLLGYPFDVHPPDVDETLAPLGLGQALEDLSVRKAGAVAPRLSHPAIILAADTIVALGDSVYAKPRDITHARAMLAALSSSTVRVLTGVCLLDSLTGHHVTFHEITDVTFDVIPPPSIERLLLADDVLDRAGAFSVQGLAGTYVARICGDYHNVMGLPLCRVRSVLSRDFGLQEL